MSPLLLLIRLQVVGWFRYVGRSLKTVKGCCSACLAS